MCKVARAYATPIEFSEYVGLKSRAPEVSVVAGVHTDIDTHWSNFTDKTKTSITHSNTRSLESAVTHLRRKVKFDHGIELLRRLCGKFGPCQANAYQMLRAKMFGLAERMC